MTQPVSGVARLADRLLVGAGILYAVIYSAVLAEPRKAHVEPSRIDGAFGIRFVWLS